MECSCSLLDLTYCQIQTTSDYPDILKHENNLVTMKERLFKSYPDSEISWFHYIRLKNHQSKVYLGNSLPIRYWDFVGGPSPNEVWANRGANGIDGQISSFLGWVLSSRSQIHSYIGVFGDLTAFYDIQSFWIYHQYKEKFKKLNIQIWIINNQGGQIFQKLLRDPVFLNQHSLRFNKISEMFDITYYRFESPAQCDDSVLKTPGLKIIEVLPNMEQQMHFDREWSQV
jgi:2-succinyl-5-enolpyruvyl-6-hydroxy-3-cyclohexene-1-carboxylate synthase